MVFSTRRQTKRSMHGGKRKKSKTKRRKKSRSRRSRKSKRRRRKGGKCDYYCQLKKDKAAKAQRRAAKAQKLANEHAADRARLERSRARSIRLGHAQRVKGTQANGFGCKDKFDGAEKLCGKKWYYYHPDGNSYYCRNPASGSQCSDVSGIWGARKRKF